MTFPGAGCNSTEIVGQSPATIRLRADIERVAAFASTVLITGPSGTGKELVARQIHAHSPRAREPFVPVDCAAMTGELMSSQLFGHVAGAFTGANCDALGCFRAANHGTLFLDEIGELEVALQAKLLRVLQERVVTPLGSHRGEVVDVRVVAATNRDLRADVVAGRFREDLFYRLDVVHLRTTALRERPSDITELAERFLRQLAEAGLPHCTLSAEGRVELVNFPWPGNVRQLRNVLEQAAIDSPSPVISAELLRRIISLSFASRDGVVSEGDQASLLGAACGEDQADEPSDAAMCGAGMDATPCGTSQLCWQTLEHLEREHIARTLAHTFNNRSAAARLLGVTRQALLRKMKRYGITANDNCRR